MGVLKGEKRYFAMPCTVVCRTMLELKYDEKIEQLLSRNHFNRTMLELKLPRKYGGESQ